MSRLSKEQANRTWNQAYKRIINRYRQILTSKRPTVDPKKLATIDTLIDCCYKLGDTDEDRDSNETHTQMSLIRYSLISMGVLEDQYSDDEYLRRVFRDTHIYIQTGKNPYKQHRTNHHDYRALGGRYTVFSSKDD